MMGMFKCKEYAGDECEALSEIANEFGLAYQWLNDIENLIGIEQAQCSDLLKNHPNAVLIRLFENKKKQFKNKVNIKNLINQNLLNENLNLVKLLLEKMMLKVHRLPIVIQPIVIALKDELFTKINTYAKN